MRQIVIMVFIGLWLGALHVLANGDRPLPADPKLIKGKLENGLTYYIYPNDNPRGEAVYRLFVKAGSTIEQDNQKGLAHFLEHMAFNGSKHFPDDGMVRFLESKGAKFGKDLNAHTSFNETVFKLQLPSANPLMVDSTLTILADWAGGLCIDSMQVEKERGVILSEWLSKTGPKHDSENALLMELLNGSRFAERLTIGDTAVIKHCSPERIRNYYNTWYRPSLMAVAVVGDVNPDQVRKLIEEKFGGLKPVEHQKAKLYDIASYKKESAKIVTHESLNTVELDMILLLPLPGAVKNETDYREYLTRALINRLLKVRMNAFAFENPTYKKASIQYSGFLNTKGILLESVELVPGKVKQGIGEFIVQQKQLFSYGFNNAEIGRVKKTLMSQQKNRIDSQQKTASDKLMEDIYSEFYVGNQLISPEQEYELLERYLPKIDSVYLVKKLTEMYRPKKMHYLLRANNEIYKEVSSTDDLLQFIAEKRKQSVIPYKKDVFIPEVLCRVDRKGTITKEDSITELGAVSLHLDNGVRVVFKPSKQDLGKIMLTGFRKGGLYSLDSLQYNSGVFASSIIPVSGAGEFTRSALNYYLAGNSASMRFLVDKTRTGIAGDAQLKDAETLFQLLYLKWTEPKLDREIYKQVIDKTKESFRLKTDTPADVFQREFSWLLSGRNYTNTELTDSLINAKVHEDVMLPLFNRFYGPADGYTFVIIGDCKLEDIRDYVVTYLGGLPKGISNIGYQFAERMIPRKDVVLERHDGDSPKAIVSLAFQQDTLLGDFRAYLLKQNVLKAVLRTSLLNHLREEMGKVYSVSVAASATRYPNFLSRTMIGFSCLPQDVDVLVEAVKKDLKNLSDHPQTFETILRDVKQNMLKEFMLDKQKNSFWSTSIRNSIYNEEENWSYFEQYEQLVNRLTVDELAAFIQSSLLEEPMVKGVLYPKTYKID